MNINEQIQEYQKLIQDVLDAQAYETASMYASNFSHWLSELYLGGQGK